MPNLQNARAIWKDLEPRGQLTLVASFLLVAVTAFLLFHFATKPSYTAVQTGLDPSDTGRVTQALASAGIAYKVTNGGTQVEVPDAKQSAAEVALAQQGATPGTRPGWELFDHQSLGTTQMQEQVNYQRALEGEI